MRILFAALMCIVFGASECLALSGGPVYPGASTVVGTYAGVLQPTQATDACGANSLGVFSIGVPKTGIASGAFVMFSQGRVFSGTVRGTADSGRSTLKGILEATFNFTVTRTFFNPVTGETTTTTTEVTAQANGNLDTKITDSRDSSFSATRLNGDARLDISQGRVNNDNSPSVSCSMDLGVIGFKQSDAEPASST